MQNPDDPPSVAANPTAEGYDAIAEAYAERLFHELDHKPFDREFLDRLAASFPVGGLVLDAGCGPGHVAHYLAGHGHRVCGVDLSGQMIRVAARKNPELQFKQGDMRHLAFGDRSLAAVVAFYSIIHFKAGELAAVFGEFHRVLAPGGFLALAFHVGNEVRHVEELFGVKTCLDFTFFDTEQVTGALSGSEWAIREVRHRPPYDPSVEAQTNRCYVLAQRLAAPTPIAGSHASP